nr:T-complex protein 1 subunit zeta-2-like isoform X1 [Pongo abelii]
MERLSLACGGMAVNSFEDLTVDCLGHAGLVYEYTLGEEKFTFIIEECVNPRSVTLLVKGPNKHTLTQVKDAMRDGLRAIKNAVEDVGCMVPGAGAIEVAMAEALVSYKNSIKGRAHLGVQAFADALLITPKVLAQNAGYDPQETLVKVQAERVESKQLVGIDLNTGEPMVAADAGVWDNYCVKKQLLHSWLTGTSQGKLNLHISASFALNISGWQWAGWQCLCLGAQAFLSLFSLKPGRLVFLPRSKQTCTTSSNFVFGDLAPKVPGGWRPHFFIC